MSERILKQKMNLIDCITCYKYPYGFDSLKGLPDLDLKSSTFVLKNG